MQAGHDASAMSQLKREHSPMHTAGHKADDADFSALPPVNPAPSVSATSIGAISLLSPLNAAPQVPSNNSQRVVPSTIPASLSSPHGVPTAPPCAMPDPSIARQARSKQGSMPGRAHSSKAWVSTTTQQGGSPTLHTLRLPDLTSNVTMATKDAFACVNAMFSSSLSHDAHPSSKPAVLVEPTVTLSTKAAFAELNQMFSSDLPHCKQHADPRQQKGLPRPAARRLIGRRLPLERPSDQHHSSRKGTSTGAVGLAQQSQSACQQPEATCTLGMYEDTCLLDNVKPGAGKVDPEGYAVYEDTKFIGNHEGAQQLATSPRANQAAGAFQIFEDTQCLQDKTGPPATAAPQDAALGVYEDTQFVNKEAKIADASGTSSADFGIYEDTQFIHKADEADAKPQFAGDHSKGGFAVHEDTQLVHKPARGVAASSDGLGIYEDTQFVGVTDGSKQSVKTQAQMAIPAAKHEEAEDKENQAGPAR